MDSTLTVLHDEIELRNFLEAAMISLIERAGNLRTTGTLDILTDASNVQKPPSPSKNINQPTQNLEETRKNPEIDRKKFQKNFPEEGSDRNLKVQFLDLVGNSSLPILSGPLIQISGTSSREALIVTSDDFVSIPLVVDVWMTKCAFNVPLFKYIQPKRFSGGLVVWSILHHYFPRDAQLSTFYEPQTRLEHAEIWSQMDLILKKHKLTRIPVEVIAAVMAHRQAGQAILLMMLYESLTNLKLPNPIPVLLDPWRYGEKEKKCLKWNFLQETVSNTNRRSTSFAQLLKKMFTTNQEMAFSRARRRLQPPRINRQFESRMEFGSGRNAQLSKLQNLTLRPQGKRCYLYHADRQHLIKKHFSREKSCVSSTSRLVLLQQPFFKTDPMVKRPRAPVG